VGLEFLERVRKTSIATGCLIALAVWLRWGPAHAAAFVAGFAWSLVNIHVIRLLVGLALDHAKSRKLRIAAVLALKVPVLYGAGYLLLAAVELPIAGVLGGFTWPLIVIVLKALGRIVLGLDRGDRSLRTAGAGGAREDA
jgi:hypothetical protein